MAAIAPELPALAARDAAFESLYRRYVKDVYHYALALLRNPADAEDVVQTTFMNAYRAMKRGEEPIKPQNWLIKIAHNVARTRYATSTRRVKEVPLEDHAEQLSAPEAEKPDVEAVLEALGRLPLNQRAALVMRELEGRSYGEIAETLGVSVPAVETLIFRARRSLRMKASAVRVLGLVPLPSSLAQLLGAGSEVAVGGVGAVGSGLILKAIGAIVAGAVATGVTVHAINPAQVQPRALAASFATSHAEHGLRLSGSRAEPRLRVTRRAKVEPSGRAARGIRRGAEDALRPRLVSTTTSAGRASSGSSSAPGSPTRSTSSSAPTTAVVATATNVVATAVNQAVSAVPAPAVSAPTVPPPPTVALPPAPPPPPLP